MQNGQGYDNNHTIRTEFESVRNPVEEKLTDASLLRTWAGLIRTERASRQIENSRRWTAYNYISICIIVPG